MIDRYTRPDFSAVALVTIDVQQDFLLGGAAEIPGTDAVLPQIARLVASFRARQLPIVHVVRLYTANGSNADLCRRALIESGSPIVRPGTSGTALAAPLSPPDSPALDTDLLLGGRLQPLGPMEWAMFKPRWGAFYDTPLDAHLRSLGRSTLAFAGCNFPNCPRTSIYEASERDYRVVLAHDAVSGIYARGQQELENIGVCVMSTDELRQALV
jgi:nicotinamidase-related amidase